MMSHRTQISNKISRSFAWRLVAFIICFLFSIVIYKTDAFNLVTYIKTTVLNTRANAAYDDRYYGDAGILYQRAVAFDSGSDVRYNLANAYCQQGRYTESAKLYEQLLAQKENRQKVAIWNNLGNTYYYQGQLFKSFDAYKMALLLNGDDNIVRQNFLFVGAELQKLLRSKGTTENGSDQKDAKDKRNQDSKQDEQGGKKSDDDKTDGPYKVSDKEMNDLLKTSKEQERVPKGSKTGKNSKQPKTDGPDY